MFDNWDPCGAGRSDNVNTYSGDTRIKLLDYTKFDFSFVRYIGKHVMNYTHVHTVYEIYFCTQSVKQRLVINGLEFTCDCPAVVISKPYTVHSMSCVDDRDVDYERYVIEFDGGLLSRYLTFREDIRTQVENSLGLLFKLSDTESAYLKSLISLYEIDGGIPLSSGEQGALFSLFLSRLFSVASDTVTVIGSHSLYINDCMKYISENISENLDYNSIAKRFAVSRSKLERDFKAACMVSPREFADMCRLKTSRALLTGFPSMTIAEISGRCGFSSETYMFTFFKKHMGISPNEYRKMQLKSK